MMRRVEVTQNPVLRELRFRPANAIVGKAHLQPSEDIHGKPSLEDRFQIFLILD